MLEGEEVCRTGFLMLLGIGAARLARCSKAFQGYDQRGLGAPAKLRLQDCSLRWLPCTVWHVKRLGRQPSSPRKSSPFCEMLLLDHLQIDS